MPFLPGRATLGIVARLRKYKIWTSKKGMEIVARSRKYKIWMLKKRNGACWLVNWLTSYYRKDLIKAVKVIRASIFTSPIWMLQLLFGLANNPI